LVSWRLIIPIAGAEMAASCAGSINMITLLTRYPRLNRGL
jgi:hypothetical protein